MIRLAGVLLLLAGAGGMGLGAAGRLTRRVRDLRDMAYALEELERQLTFQMPPMSVLLEGLARRWRGEAGAFFAACARNLDRLETCPMSQIWREALADSGLSLGEEGRAALEEVGEALGRYDGPRQGAALSAARSRLERCLDRAEEERRRLSRVYGAVSLAAGGFLAVILL